jgi:Holliday junction resolvase RusA-like endonuclease
MRINIKPLSVNECWQGKRFKTPKYKSYEQELLFRLNKYKLPQPPFEIHFKFGFSSKLSDWDNPIKPLQDILQKKYGFDDRDIFKAIVEKEIVKKGQDYLEFNIIKYKK